MPRWTFFGAVAVVLTVAFVLLARRSATVLRAALEARADLDAPPHPAGALLDSDRRLVGNVLTSHGLVLALTLAAVWAAAVPLEDLGVARPRAGALAAGVAAGLLLAAGNEASARLAERLGLDRDERLRELLAPSSRAGWLALLLLVLPLVAVAEELLFRAVLIGGLAAGFGLPAWGFAVVSSVAFGLGHGLQGQAGVTVATGLGLALAAVFVLTGSLAAVVVAHYLVNALEFGLHEGVEAAD